MKYKDKNSFFNTDGNESIDKILCIVDLSILSGTFNDKIKHCSLFILTNYRENTISDITEEIEYIKISMKWLKVFTDEFIDIIYQGLCNGLEYEIIKKSEQKYNL